jgi:hypothetical protein
LPHEHLMTPILADISPNEKRSWNKWRTEKSSFTREITANIRRGRNVKSILSPKYLEILSEQN